jgi:transcriptional regulator of acetoin/glycerol metabolism
VQAPADAARRSSLTATATVAAVQGAAVAAARGAVALSAPAPQRVDADSADVLASAECAALRRTLEACRWNISATAVRLRLSRRTIYRKMYRHGIARHDLDEAAGK